jgi:hypothetical protein
MKIIDYIVALFFIVVIGIKLYFFIDVRDNLCIPIELYLFGIVSIITLFISIGFIRFKIKAAKILIAISVLMGVAEAFWRFNINDIGLAFLIFRIVGYILLGVILWSFVSSRMSSSEKLNQIQNTS